MRRLLSLVIVGFNKVEHSARCLASLLHVTWRPLEIVFVNNGSTDRTAEILEEFREAASEAAIGVTVLPLPHNTGSIVSRNLAIPMCAGEYLGFLDNDVILRSRDLFEILIERLESRPDIGIVTPKMLYPVPPYRIQCAGGGMTREGCCYLLGRGAERTDPEFNHATSLPWAISACIVMPIAVVRALGPLDESLSPVGFEDTDYCLRCRAHGLSVVYEPRAEIYHAENTTTFGTPSVRIHAVMRRNQYLFRKKWKHMFPTAPSVRDLPAIHMRQPATPLWSLGELPMTGRSTPRSEEDQRTWETPR
jgi:GT2 family glycosyltransferase